MWSLLLQTLALASLTSAHFIMLWPPAAGFDEDKEPTSPCGGFTPTINSTTPDVQVNRFAVSIQNVHPVGEWSFRGTTDTKAPFKFTEIVPVVNTTGIGDFCLDYMKVPSSWAGKSGVIQIVDNSPDGILYQCAPVNFVIGSNNTVGPACANASNFDATWTTLEGFNGESESSSGSKSMSTSESSSATAGSASSTSAGAAAIFTGVGSLVGGLGLLAAGFAF